MDSLPINVTDLAVLAVLVISGLLAFLRGFVAEVLSVVAWIGATVAGAYGYKPLQPLVTDLTGLDGTLADMVAGVVLFVAVLIALMVLARLLGGTLRMAGLGAVDRSLGFLFGLLRGAVLICVAYIVVVRFVPDPADHPAWLTGAKTLPVVAHGSELMVSLLPQHLQSQIGATTSRLRKQGEDAATEALKQRLLSPTPKASAPNTDAPNGDQGYTDKERQGLNRVIQSTQ